MIWLASVCAYKMKCSKYNFFYLVSFNPFTVKQTTHYQTYLKLHMTTMMTKEQALSFSYVYNRAICQHRFESDKITNSDNKNVVGCSSTVAHRVCLLYLVVSSL